MNQHDNVKSISSSRSYGSKNRIKQFLSRFVGLALLFLAYLPAILLLNTTAALATTLAWTNPAPAEGYLSAGFIQSVSCPSTTFCVAGDFSGNATIYNGSTWSSPTLIDSTRNIESVSCPTNSFCLAVDKGGNASLYNGSTWSSPTIVDINRYLQSVSCATSTFCVAVDNSEDAVLYNGSTWSIPAAIDSGSIMVSVSCPRTTFCVAVGSAGNSDGNAVIYNGSTWLSPTLIGSNGYLASVSCSATTFCIAVDSIGNYMMSGIPPQLTGLSSNFGNTTGGTNVVISGTNFLGATAVNFGSNPASSFKVVSFSEIIATSPPGLGTVNVTVTTLLGTTSIVSADQFSYVNYTPINPVRICDTRPASGLTPLNQCNIGTILNNGPLLPG